MAKRSTKKELKSYVTYVKDEHKVIVHDSFLYEVEIFICATRCYYLKDTVIIAKEAFKEPKKYVQRMNGRIVNSHYKLIGAPLEWLQTNRYNLITNEP